jgi:hypothetical protein
MIDGRSSSFSKCENQEKSELLESIKRNGSLFGTDLLEQAAFSA